MKHSKTKIECGYCHAQYDTSAYNRCPHCGWTKPNNLLSNHFINPSLIDFTNLTLR